MLRNTIFGTLALTLTLTTSFNVEASEPRALDATHSDNGASEPALAAWEAALTSAVTAAEQAHPDVVATLRALAPVPTRAGHPRFVGDVLDHSVATAVLLDRLLKTSDPPAVRMAIADILPQTSGAYATALVGLMAREGDALVRSAIVTALRRGASTPALAGLKAGLADADPRVREAAAAVVARRSDGHTLADLVIARLADTDATVQATAAQSLGAMAIAAAFTPLQRLLTATDAQVRLHALRALGRIDSSRTAKLPQLASLREDPDARVRRVAITFAAVQAAPGQR